VETAFVLIQSNAREDSNLESLLRKINEVKDVFVVHGIYDYIVKLETYSMIEMNKIIATKIKQLKNIRLALTLVSLE